MKHNIFGDYRDLEAPKVVDTRPRKEILIDAIRSFPESLEGFSIEECDFVFSAYGFSIDDDSRDKKYAKLCKEKGVIPYSARLWTLSPGHFEKRFVSSDGKVDDLKGNRLLDAEVLSIPSYPINEHDEIRAKLIFSGGKTSFHKVIIENKYDFGTFVGSHKGLRDRSLLSNLINNDYELQHGRFKFRNYSEPGKYHEKESYAFLGGVWIYNDTIELTVTDKINQYNKSNREKVLDWSRRFGSVLTIKA